MTKALLPVFLLSLTSMGFGKLLYLNATEVKYLHKDRLVEALEGVKVRYGEYTLTADRIRYDFKTETLVAEGNVFFTDWRDIFLRAGRAVYYLRRGEIDLYNPEGRIKEGYFKAQFARLTGKVYVLHALCASKCADYSAEICAKKFVFKPKEGEGTAYSVKVKVEGKPIFYTPYYGFLTKRKSGFLSPSAGIDSYGDFIYLQPYYWAIDKHSDATFTADYRTGGLYGFGAEYRRYFSHDFYLETLNQFYYDDAYPGRWWEGRDYRRRYRYLLSGRGHRGNLSFQWEYPSDIDYYYDIFFFDKENHYKSFAKSFLQYSLNGRYFNLNLKGEYFYNLTTEDRSKDLATIPDIYFYLKPLNLGRGFSLDLTSELTNFYTDNRSLWRFRFAPKLDWRHTFGTTPVTAYLKPYYIYYSSKRYGNRRHIAGFEFTLRSLLYSFDLVRTSNTDLFSSWEWVYTLNPFEEKNTPSFDWFDELSKKNILTLRGMNTLRYRGKTVAELIVEQPYNFYNGYNFPTDGAFVDGKLLPLKIYYNLTPPSGDFSIDGKLYYDHNRVGVFYTSTSLKWTAVKTLLSRLELETSYSLSKDHKGHRQSEQLSYGLRWKWRRLSLEGKNYYDAIVEKNVKSSVAVNFRKDCWGVGFRYEREYNFDSDRYEWRVLFVFNLFGNPLNFLISGGRE